jgi:hypothetical protein
VSISPENCQKDTAPVLQQQCDYYLSSSFQASVATSSVSAAPAVPCVYSYSAWGACISKRQTRMLISALPQGCDASLMPVLSQNCKESSAALPAIAGNAPAPAPVSALSLAPKTVANFNDRTSATWQQYYFSVPNCQNEKICGGNADPDNDGLTNNDEYRFGTNPLNPDTDRDGMVDGEEIQTGRNPLVADSKTASDAVIYESPKDKGAVNGDILKIDKPAGGKLDTVKSKTGKNLIKLTGKALPNTYVTIYVYSDPLVLTVKTDSDGNWSYVLDKPMENGGHEVYVAVNDNAGKIIAKSSPMPFVQTAEAATVTYPANLASEERAPAPTKSRLLEGYLIFFCAGMGGLLLALAAIGFVKSSKNEQ